MSSHRCWCGALLCIVPPAQVRLWGFENVQESLALDIQLAIDDLLATSIMIKSERLKLGTARGVQINVLREIIQAERGLAGAS